MSSLLKDFSILQQSLTKKVIFLNIFFNKYQERKKLSLEMLKKSFSYGLFFIARNRASAGRICARSHHEVIKSFYFVVECHGR